MKGSKTDITKYWNPTTYNRDDLFPGCDQYHLLELQLDVHETPTKLFWRPGKFTRNLSLNISTGCVAKYEIAQSSSQSWFDITFQRASGGKPTLVKNGFYQTCISSDVLRLTFIVTVNGLLLNKICRTSLKWTAFLHLSFTSSTHKTNNLWWLCCREPQCCQQHPSQHITNLPRDSETNQSNWSDKPEWYFKDAKLFLLPLRGWPRLVFYHILRRVGALREGVVISVIGMVVLIKVLLSRGVMMIGPTME